MDKLSTELAKIFEAEIEKVIQKEINDPDYLPQSDFTDSKTPCTDRADHMILDALPAVVNTLGLAVAKHRKEQHDEDTLAEMEILSADLTDKQQEVGLMGWWRH